MIRKGPFERAYRLPDKVLIIGQIRNKSTYACVLTADSKANPSAFGSAVLEIAQAEANGRGKSYPSDFFEYAVLLPTGNLITHDLRPKEGGTYRHIISLTGPITEDQVPDLIYN